MSTEPDFLSACYRTAARDRAPFGDHWCGPAVLTREWVEIARYAKDPEDGDGRDVTVFCSALPARFYRIEAHQTPDSCGTPRPGFVITTGSDMSQWVAQTAELIASGMISAYSGEYTE